MIGYKFLYRVIIIFGVVYTQMAVTALGKPNQLFILASAGCKKYLALFGYGINILFAENKQNGNGRIQDGYLSV